MKNLDDVIAAIATPIGEGGIAVIRISGKGAIEIGDASFRGRAALVHAQSHTVHYGQFVDKEGMVIDEVLAAVFRAPRSYTVEDLVEISCHGGLYISRKILDAVIASGARLAEPGEFTKRAFLNGRIDLSQAEAVADLIQSRSELARRSSLLQLQGSLSTKLNGLIKELTNICSLVELELDFIEENITLTKPETLAKDLGEIISELESLVKTFEYGRFCRDGVKVVLVGRPNVGKSSLLNTLLDRNRAIVTDIPGTTRDVIEENIVIDGMLFRLVDTAGVRLTDDAVEKEGVRRTREQVQQADLCLYVLDVSTDDRREDMEFIEEVRSLRNSHDSGEILVANKIDLAPKGISKSNPFSNSFSGIRTFFVSALTRQGIDDLTSSLVEICTEKSINLSENSVTITNERHKEGLERAIWCLQLARESIGQSRSGEIVAVDLREALDALGAIVGTVTTDDILEGIFSKFCIGK